MEVHAIHKTPESNISLLDFSRQLGACRKPLPMPLPSQQFWDWAKYKSEDIYYMFTLKRLTIRKFFVTHTLKTTGRPPPLTLLPS